MALHNQQVAVSLNGKLGSHAIPAQEVLELIGQLSSVGHGF